MGVQTNSTDWPPMYQAPGLGLQDGRNLPGAGVGTGLGHRGSTINKATGEEVRVSPTLGQRPVTTSKGTDSGRKPSGGPALADTCGDQEKGQTASVQKHPEQMLFTWPGGW